MDGYWRQIRRELNRLQATEFFDLKKVVVICRGTSRLE